LSEFFSISRFEDSLEINLSVVIHSLKIRELSEFHQKELALKKGMKKHGTIRVNSDFIKEINFYEYPSTPPS